jgi:hypothetical protein
VGSPFLAVTLDAKRRLDRTERALELPRGRVHVGFLDLLEHVWERKDSHVNALVIAACFGPDERLPAALVTFGFLVPAGAEWELDPEETARLLNTYRQRVAAGKARIAKAKRNARGTLQRSTSDSTSETSGATSGQPAGTPASHQRRTSEPPAADQLLHPAPSTQHQNNKSLRAAGGPAPKEPDWRMKPTIDALCSAYLKARGVKYPFDGGKEAKCVERLLSRAPPETILPAWSRALAEGGYPKVATLLEFERALPHFLGAAPQAVQRRPTGAATAADTDWSNYEGPEVSGT